MTKKVYILYLPCYTKKSTKVKMVNEYLFAVWSYDSYIYLERSILSSFSTQTHHPRVCPKSQLSSFHIHFPLPFRHPYPALLSVWPKGINTPVLCHNSLAFSGIASTMLKQQKRKKRKTFLVHWREMHCG